MREAISKWLRLWLLGCHGNRCKLGPHGRSLVYDPETLFATHTHTHIVSLSHLSLSTQLTTTVSQVASCYPISHRPALSLSSTSTSCSPVTCLTYSFTYLLISPSQAVVGYFPPTNHLFFPPLGSLSPLSTARNSTISPSIYSPSTHYLYTISLSTPAPPPTSLCHRTYLYKVSGRQ